MFDEYPILLFFIAIIVGCCSYFFYKKVNHYFDSGKKPYLTYNIYILGPSFVMLIMLLFLNFGMGLFGVSGVYMQFFKQNDFENIARSVEAIDKNLSNPLLSVSEKNNLVKKKENYIQKVESGSLSESVKINLDVSYEDLYGAKNHNKELTRVVNHSLANTNLERKDD